MVMVSASPDRSRRALLRGVGARAVPARPPWALAEAAFIDACTRCDACIAACPQRVLVRGDGGFPELAWGSGECTFCQACVQTCAPGALDRALGARWPWRAAIASHCLAQRGVVCQSCREVCPEHAIRFTPAQPQPQPLLAIDACTGCGACVAVCPVAAIGMTTPAAAA